MNNFNYRGALPAGARRGMGGYRPDKHLSGGLAEEDAVATIPATRRTGHVAQMRAYIATQCPGTLTAAEQEDLLLMREEEKIARDVYLRLYDQWGLRPFGNISGSEQAHMDMMLALLEHHGLADPVEGLPVGKFHRTDLQGLHDSLLEQGLGHQADAIKVGLLIEELDIADLRKATARTARPETLRVYAELERGSRNHLRAFYRWKQRYGIEYQTAHLEQDEFERIARSAHETCQ
jgi:hypothetical protein